MWPSRRNLGAGCALAAMLAVEYAALRAGSLGAVAVGAVAGLVALLAFTRFSLASIAIGTSYAAALTLTWNGWFVGPLRPGDVLILLAVLLFVIAHTNRAQRLPRLPVWVWQAVVAIVLVVAANVIWRPDPLYLANRIVLDAPGLASPLARKPFLSTNISVAVKFVIAVAIVPLVFAFAATYSRRIARRLVVLFAVGAAISGWVAILGRYGVTTLNRVIGTSSPGAPRQIGLSNQPNYLAASVVLALPVGVWLLLEADRRTRALGAFVTLGCVLGAYASGSRGGAVCIVFALGLSVVLIPRARRFALPAFFAALTAADAIYLLAPHVGHAILKATRLVGASTVTDPSDQARGIAAHQALLDFVHSPIHGIGLQVSFDAQTVYLQLMQAGGLILLGSMLVYNGAAIVTSFRMIRLDPLAAALCASVIGALALDVFEADITDRFYYVPIAAIVALRYSAREPSVPERELVPA